jgi:flagellar M-ring protein FliF
LENDKTQGTFASALRGLGHLSGWRQVGLMVAIAASVTLGVMIALWSRTPNYTLLYGSLAGKSGAEVVEALERADIPFRLDNGSGAILVPSSKVHEARLKLAAEGLPRTTDLGFELLDKKQAFGTSEFIERARYQRALEGELARSIATLNNVEGARVHLGVPRQSVFLRDRRKPSASVLVRLYPGRRLERGQVAAIAHLIAAAIPNLESSQVRVIDEMGRLLTSPDTADELSLSHRELEYSRAVEKAYVKNIEEILTPVVGAGAFRAQVVVDVDFTKTEESREVFEPKARAVRSEKVSEQRTNNPFEGGIPGALSNQPPGGSVVPEEVTPPSSENQPPDPTENIRTQATRNYELDRTVSHTRMPSTRVRRLSVAVVLDDHRSVDTRGQPSHRSRTPEEIDQITSLVKEAIGFSSKRGDTLKVTNVPFAMTAGEPQELPAPPLWERPWIWNLAKQLGGMLLVGLLVLGVFRPLVRSLAGRDGAVRNLGQPESPARLAAPQGDEPAADRLSLSASGQQTGASPASDQSRYEKNLESVKAVVMSDPKRVASVVRNWLGENG